MRNDQIRHGWVAIATLLMTATGLRAGESYDPSDQLSKLFGPATAFTATAHITARDEKGNVTLTSEIEMAMLDGKLRSEIDFGKIRGAKVEPTEIQQLKTLGIKKTISIQRPDKKLTYVLFPDLNGYYEEAPSNLLPAEGATPPKVEKKELGKEVVDGHSCTHYGITVTPQKGDVLKAETWEAADLQSFPVRILLPNKQNSAMAQFKNVKFIKPAASLFDPPAQLKKYKNIEDLMTTVLLEGLSSTPKKK